MSRRFAQGPPGHPPSVFFLFSNRLGCLGSLLLSLVLTAVVVLLITLL